MKSKRNKKQKITALAAALTLLLGCAAPSFAEGADEAAEITVTDGAALSSEEITSIVKGKLDIPAEFSQFSISSSSDSDGNMTYRLIWYIDSDTAYGEISVMADGDGHILSYSKYDDYESDIKLVSDSSGDALTEINQNELRKMLPECFANDYDTYLVTGDPVINPDGSGSAVYKRFVAPEGGDVSETGSKYLYTVWGNTINVHYRKTDDGYELTSMNSNHDYDAVFGENTPDSVDINESYKALSGGRLQYDLLYKYDEITGKTTKTPVLRFVLKDTPFMDPATGEEITEDSSVIYPAGVPEAGGGTTSNSTAEDSSHRAELSEEELAEITKLNTLMTSEEIMEELINAPEFDVTSDMTVRSERIYKNTETGKYYISLNIANDAEGDERKTCNVSANAETGLITMFNMYSYAPYNGETEALTDEELEEAPSGQAILEKYADGFENYALDDRSGERRGSTYINETYRLLVNGIPYMGSSANIEFNANNNKVSYMSISETEPDTEFPDPSGAVSADEAYKTLINSSYSPIRVFVKSDGVYKKAYTIDLNGVCVDAVNNVVVNEWDNEPVSDFRLTSQYEDIEGHWAADMINQFKNFGYTVGSKDGLFKPDEYITAEDFIELARQTMMASGSDSVPLEETLGIESEADLALPVTREKAVTAMIKYAGFTKIAELKDIFLVHFDDEDEISPECFGSCAIAQGLGIVNGSGGNFEPQRHVTRAEAVSMIYRYISD